MPLQRAWASLESDVLASLIDASRERVRNFRWSPVLGLDLGSESSRMMTTEAGATPISIPSRIAIDAQTDSIVAIGHAAQRMTERAPTHLRVEAPIRSGGVAQPDLAEVLIRHLLQESIGRRRLARPAMVIAAPAGATSVQLHALVAVAQSAGAGRVTLIRESIAAALGAGLPLLAPEATFVVELGAEKTEIAVIALGGIVVSTTLQVGGSHISEAIASYLRLEHQLLIGRASSDAIKVEIGSAIHRPDPKKASARGRDIRSGLPATVELKTEELVVPIQGVLDELVAAIHGVLERTPPELSADITSSGIHLSGGGSLLTGLSAFLERSVQLPTEIVPEPLNSVVRGCQRCAKEPRLLSELSWVA